MKSFIPALMLMLLVACSKESVIAPNKASQTVSANTAVSYKDNSISVVDFNAKPNNETIEVTFTTLYEKNVVTLEVLKGMTANNLCSIYKQEINKDSYSAIKYSTSDQNSYDTNALYYMVKYTLTNGDWGYTPVFKLSL